MASLDERITQLEAELASLKAQPTNESARETPDAAGAQGAGPTSRRQLLKLAGAAAVGAAGASLLSATPARATTGTMMFGAINDAGTDTTTLTSSSFTGTLLVNNTNNGAALVAQATNAGNPSTAVQAATVGSGPALTAQSVSGYGLVARGGLAPLLLVPAVASGPPTTGLHTVGEIVVDSSGALFQCVSTGTAGAWVRVGFNPLTPVRILDTRNGTGGITGPLTAGQTVNLTVGGNHGVPDQASAVVMNATIAEPTAASFLTIWPAGVTRPLASNLNWTPGQIVPNLVTVKLGTNAGISIFNNVGDVQVILDLAGFYA